MFSLNIKKSKMVKVNSTEVELGQSPGGFTRPPLWYIYFTPKGIYIYIPFLCKKSKKKFTQPNFWRLQPKYIYQSLENDLATIRANF